MTTGDTNATTTYAGVISGTGGLVKQGSGTFTLSGVIQPTMTFSVAPNLVELNPEE